MAHRFSRALLVNLTVALLALGAGLSTPALSRTTPSGYTPTPTQQVVLDDLERRTFDWFWDNANPANGLVPDRAPSKSPSSIASVGFGLTAYGIGVKRGYISRDQAIQRTLTTLKFFANAPMGPAPTGETGYKGFYYHFLDMKTGRRFGRTELSTIDTTLLMGGVLFAQSFYDRNTPGEREIRALADKIYRRIDWTWAQHHAPLVSMGWHPKSGFIPADWKGYDEGMILYVMALGSPTHPVEPAAWTAWTKTYAKSWGRFNGQMQLGFAPLFGHQYSESWIDYRDIQDAFMHKHDLTYFQNSRRAAYAQRDYAIANPQQWAGYGPDIWGLTASDGPGHISLVQNGRKRVFHGYWARGVALGDVRDDGTIAPTAAAASIGFAPRIAIPAIVAMRQRYGEYIYGKYGFKDAFNMSFHAKGRSLSGSVIPGFGWVAHDYLGIDQGPILLMLENYRSGFVWQVMRRNPHIRRGLERAGFTGGWLEAKPATR